MKKLYDVSAARRELEKKLKKSPKKKKNDGTLSVLFMSLK